MRLLHSCQTLSRSFGGVFEAVRQLTAEQIDADPECLIQVIGAKDIFRESDQNQWAKGITRDYSVLGPRQMGWSPSIGSLYAEFQPDIVHVHGLWMYYGLANLQMTRRLQVPYLVSPHGMLDPWALKNAALKKLIVRWIFENRHLAKATCLHALCKEEAAEIRSLGFTNPVCVIPNGVHLSGEDMKSEPPWQNAIPKDANVMLFLGRIHPKKGLDNLLSAWRQVVAGRLQSSPRWILVIAGWGNAEYVEQLKRQVRELELQNHVHFAGPVFGDLKSASLQCAHAFVLPSLSEGLPMAVLEAWMHRLPVLMTSECHLDIGFEQMAAMRIESTVQQLAESMRDFLSQPESARIGMGLNGFSLVSKKFTWTKIAHDFHRVYSWMRNLGPCPTDLMFDR